MAGNAPLTVSLNSTLSTIKIEIGVKTLLHAVMLSPNWPSEFVVRKEDEKEFIKDFMRGMEAESEDGTTPIHLLFDDAALECLEQGSEGIAEVPGDYDGVTLEARLVELRAEMSEEDQPVYDSHGQLHSTLPADPFENFSVQDLQAELARRGMAR